MSVAREEQLGGAARRRLTAKFDRGFALRAVGIACFLLVVLFVLPLAGDAWTKTFTGAAIWSVVAASASACSTAASG